MAGMKKLLLSLATICLLNSGTAQASLVDRGGGLIFDTVLNITWLQDANYAKTSGHDSDGLMNWYAAMNWAENLSFYDTARGVTYTDWRLPTTTPALEGYNQTGSELGHLYYLDLGNTVGQSNSTGFFQNVFVPGEHWSVFWSSTSGWKSTNQGNDFYAYTFIFNDGDQDTTDPSYFERRAWAVRDGDVAAVPEPETYAMLLAGLGLLGFMSRRKKQFS